MHNRNFIIYVFTLFIASCSFNLDVNKPINLLWDKLEGKSDSLIILLPGIYDTAETFKDEQFFKIARNAGIKADMVAANIHLWHLVQEMMIERIEKDIFQQVKNKGYKNIWFVGISLGGLNSLLVYQKHTKDVCGVVVVSPYIADKGLTKELKQAGGIKKWQPNVIENKKTIEKRLQLLWVWLQQQDLKNNLNQVFLGYGKQDRYLKAIKLFENILNKKNVVKVEGEHDWDTGQKIWQKQLTSRLKTGLLQSCN